MAASIVNVTDILDERKLSAFQKTVIALCAAIVFVEGMNAQAAGYIAPSIRAAMHMSPSDLGYFFSSGLIGLMVGAILIAPLADRIGRRPVLIGCVAFFGTMSFAAAASTSILMLDTFRFLTGLGIGAGMANAIALTAEYAPASRRSSMVAVMLIGFISGAIVVGLVAAEFVPVWGWRSIFILDGILPLLLLPVLFSSLPESLRFMIVKERPREAVARLIRRMDPSLAVDADTRLVVEEERASGASVAALFRNGRGGSTLLLWTIYFMSLLNLYLFANWLTVHMTTAGIPLERAIFIHSLFQVGGVFGAVFGWVFDRAGPSRAIFLAYLIGGIAIACIGLAGANVPLLIVSVLVAGFGIIGGQSCANALAAISYPTQIRSTGVGWATGVGRAGSIIGPGLAGILVEAGMSTADIFYLAVIPALIAALAGVALGGLKRSPALKEGVA